MLITLSVSVALADDVVAGANLTAMGRVGVAAAEDNAAISLNPGLLGLRERYDFLALFAVGPNGGLGWGGSAVDGRTSAGVAAGLAYRGGRLDPPLTVNDLPGWIEPGEEVTNIERHHDFQGAVSVPFADRRVSIGITALVTYANDDRGDRGFSGDGHVGLGLQPLEALTVGLVGRNVLPMSGEDPPAEVLGGARIDVRPLAVEANGGWREGSDDPVLAAGLDKSLGENGALRAGWRFDEGEHSLGLGLGWVDAAGSLEYGVTLPLRDVSFASTVHVLSLRFSAPREPQAE